MLKKITPVVLSMLLLFGCASGPRYSTVKESIPPLAEGYSRIYFYRTSHFGGAWQPAVYINEEKYGAAYLEGVFFKDVLPGKYTITTSMSQGRQVDLDLPSGQVRYVRFQFRIGFAVYPELVEPSVGQAEIQKLAYVGNPDDRNDQESAKTPAAGPSVK